MKILLTGSSGFLGKIFMDNWHQGHVVIRVGRDSRSEVICDLSKSIPGLPAVDLVVHAAGKAHSIPATSHEEEEFYRVNVQGTQNLLLGLKASGVLPRVLVFISSVAVYGKESGELLSEQTPLDPITAYGKSKALAEKLVGEWGQENNVKTVILRLPLIIGPNAPGNLGAMVRAISNGFYVRIGDGLAKRSVVRAVDVAHLILTLKDKQGIFNLTDGYHPAIREIDSLIAMKLGKKIRTIPNGIAKILAKTGDILSFLPFNSNKLEKLTHSLSFSDQLARQELNWSPGIFSLNWEC